MPVPTVRCLILARGMLRGLNTVNLDAKGRLAVPARLREGLARLEVSELVLTVNPWDRNLWLYPLPEWTEIEAKLSALSDVDLHQRRTKQIIRGYATDCSCDAQGRVLLPAELRKIAGLVKEVVVLGQGNKLEIWDAAGWRKARDRWLEDVAEGVDASASALDTLSL